MPGSRGKVSVKRDLWPSEEDSVSVPHQHHQCPRQCQPEACAAVLVAHRVSRISISSAKPRMLVSGVRNSCETAARKTLVAWLA